MIFVVRGVVPPGKGQITRWRARHARPRLALKAVNARLGGGWDGDRFRLRFVVTRMFRRMVFLVTVRVEHILRDEVLSLRYERIELVLLARLFRAAGEV